MTTLADINQTLTVQNEMQEKTTKAVDSLTKRFASFLRITKGDRLEDLESRREARRESRAMGFARAAGNVAESVKRQTPLLLKILGGAAVAAYILQNKELRDAIGGLLSESVKLINETVFQNPEFQRGLKEVGTVIGNAIGDAFKAVTPNWVNRLLGDDPTPDTPMTPEDQAEIDNARIGAATLVGATAVTAKMAMDVANPTKWVKGFTNGPRRTGGGLEEARQLKADQKAARIAAQRAAAANAAQQRFNANQVTRLSTSQKLTQMTSNATLGQRVTNLARGVGRSVNAASRTVRGGPGMTAATVAGSLLNAPMLGNGTITKIEPETGAEVRVTGYGSEFANIGEAAVAASEAGKILSLAERDFLRTRDEGLLKYQRLLSQLTLDFEQASYINRLLEARARLLTEENLPPSTGDPILDAAQYLAPSPQSKVPALEQAMDGAGTGQPIIVPVPIPMDAGKGPGPVVSQGTVGGSLSAGETIHLNQDPATIIGGVPRQQSGGGGGW